MISLAQFVTALAGGATLGGIFAVTSLGLVLAFRATRTFNFAHGEMMLVPAMIVGYLELHRFSMALSLVIALVSAAAIGALFYLLALRHTTGKAFFLGVIATFGLASVLDGLIGIFFTASEYTVNVPGASQGSVELGGAHINTFSLGVAGVTLALAVIVMIVVRFTHLGLVLRAAGQDSLLASQSGINVRTVYLASWAAASVLAAIAGISYGAVTVANTSMVNLGLAAIPAIALGGMDSIEGAIVGGLSVGVAQGFIQVYLGGQYVDPLTYALLLVVLLVYPQGLFGTQMVERA